MKEEVLVSVVMPSYNHEKYVCQAVDSVLAQKTNFEYEILVGDDASTDGTRNLLISKYKENNKVRLFLRRKNVGGTKNGYNLFMQANGKYLCICECDDYWTDQYYLQTMVDWMESHIGYAAVGARRIALSEKTNRKAIMQPAKDFDYNILLEDFVKGYKMFDLCACLFTNFFHDGKCDYRTYRMSKHVGDLQIIIYILQHGKYFQLNRIIGVYRTDRIKGKKNYNSVTNSKEKFLDHIGILKYMEKFCYSEIDYSHLQSRYADDFLNSAKPGIEKIKTKLVIVKKISFRALLRLMFSRMPLKQMKKG